AGEVRGVVGDPADARVPAEPRLLPAGEPPGGPDGLLLGLLLRPLARQEPQHLRVAEGAPGGQAVAEAGALQLADLVDEPRLPHALHAQGYALVQFRAGDAQPYLHDRAVAVPVLGQGGGERPAGYLDHLEGPDDAAAVARQDRLGGDGVDRAQPLVQRG